MTVVQHAVLQCSTPSFFSKATHLDLVSLHHAPAHSKGARYKGQPTGTETRRDANAIADAATPAVISLIFANDFGHMSETARQTDRVLAPPLEPFVKAATALFPVVEFETCCVRPAVVEVRQRTLSN